MKMAFGDHGIIMKYVKSTTNPILQKLLKSSDLDGFDSYLEVIT